jgi:methylmalonyl-CoA mutase N-terminal domain/subunit
LRARRDNAAVIAALDRLEHAAQTDGENVLPYLVDCCHAYATVGEMVTRLKRCWGEFREPIRL